MTNALRRTCLYFVRDSPPPKWADFRLNRAATAIMSCAFSTNRSADAVRRALARSISAAVSSKQRRAFLQDSCALLDQGCGLLDGICEAIEDCDVCCLKDLAWSGWRVGSCHKCPSMMQ